MLVVPPLRGRMHRSGKGTLMMVRVVCAEVRAQGFADAKHLKACDDDRFDLVQRRIAAADVDKILMSHAMGREIAWVKKTRD